jgi:hypothetical protein
VESVSLGSLIISETGRRLYLQNVLHCLTPECSAVMLSDAVLYNNLQLRVPFVGAILVIAQV